MKLTTGLKRRNNGITDEEIMKEIIDKKGMEKEGTRIIYTDGSKSEERTAEGAAIVKEEKEESFYFSMDKRCSVYTTEIAAIVKARVSRRESLAISTRFPRKFGPVPSKWRYNIRRVCTMYKNISIIILIIYETLK